MAFALLGFLFVIISLPMLNTMGVYSHTTPNNAILYASNINAWLAVFASVLGTFTADAIILRKFSVHDLVFTGTAVKYLYNIGCIRMFYVIRCNIKPMCSIDRRLHSKFRVLDIPCNNEQKNK